MKLEHIGRLETFASGVIGPLAITTWDGPPTIEQGRIAASLLHHMRQTEPSILVLAVVGAGTSPPEPDVRTIVSQAVTQLGDKTRAVCQVVEGQGFRAAAIRGVLIGMGLVIRAKHPEKVCQTVDESAEFLATHSDRRLLPRDIIRAVAELRGET